MRGLREWVSDQRRAKLDVTVPVLTGGDIKLLELMRREGFPPEGKGRGRVAGVAAYLRMLSAAWSREYGSRMRPAGLRSRWMRLGAKHPDVVRVWRLFESIDPDDGGEVE